MALMDQEMPGSDDIVGPSAEADHGVTVPQWGCEVIGSHTLNGELQSRDNRTQVPADLLRDQGDMTGRPRISVKDISPTTLLSSRFPVLKGTAFRLP